MLSKKCLKLLSTLLAKWIFHKERSAYQYSFELMTVSWFLCVKKHRPGWKTEFFKVARLDTHLKWFRVTEQREKLHFPPHDIQKFHRLDLILNWWIENWDSTFYPVGRLKKIMGLNFVKQLVRWLCERILRVKNIRESAGYSKNFKFIYSSSWNIWSRNCMIELSFLKGKVSFVSRYGKIIFPIEKWCFVDCQNNLKLNK